MRNLKYSMLVCSLLASTAACSGTAPEAEEGETDATGQNMTASYFKKYIPKGSPTEKAVLALMNDRSLSADEYVEKCQFSRAVSANIVNYRDGDEPADTSDDQLFNNVKEIDRVPFTDRSFFAAAIACSKDYLPKPGGICSTGTSKVQQSSLYLEFVVDNSGSMTGKPWDAARDALNAVFDEQEAKNDAQVGMGLRIFPKPASGVSTVPIAAVDQAQLAALKGALPSSLGGDTPMHGALTDSYDMMDKFVPGGNLAPGGTKAVILLSDGVPTDTDTATVLSLVQSKASAMQTFAMGIGEPSASTSQYDVKFMGQLAVNGGTRRTASCDPSETTNEANMCHFQLTPSASTTNQLAKDLLDAIAKIRADIASCDIGLQATGTGAADPAQVSVVVTDGNGNDTVVAADPVNGYSLDDPQNPTKVLIRGTACDQLRSDVKLSARVTLQCK